MYREALKALLSRTTKNKGIEPPFELYNRLGNPQLTYPTVHIAGTNGKGSVSTKIAAVLQNSGYRVGLYTSPHICCFRERIQINGEYISEEAFVKLIQEILPYSSDYTFFEITTAIAFQHFANQKVDISIIEVGLGGRLDATNALNPLLTLITSIDYDHTHILGNTLEDIAKEKAGIVQKEVPVIIGKTVPSKCVAFAKEVYKVDSDDPREIASKGIELLKNQFSITDTSGLNSLPPCRMEMYHNERIILDVAHNPASLNYLFKKLEQKFGKEKYRIIFGLCKTKDAKQCMQIIDKHSTQIILTSSDNERSYKTGQLLQFAKKIESTKVTTTLPNLFQKGERFLVCGSFFILPKILKLLNINVPFDPIDMNEKII